MWSAKIIETSTDGKHRFLAENSDSGEKVFGRIGVTSPVLSVMPKSFFDALNDCMKKFSESSTDFTDGFNTFEHNEMHGRWDDITEDVTTPKRENKNWQPYLGTHFNIEGSD